MKNLAVSLVLDRSGSMASHWERTLDACNEYLNALKTNGADTTVTVTVFDSQSIDCLRDQVSAADCKPITSAEVTPRGSTPLLDAVGTAIDKLDTRTKRGDEGVALVVMTDGQENCSREHKRADIKAKLADRQSKDNWLVVFLGEGVDAWGEGGKLGTVAGSTIQYSGANVHSAMRSASAATMCFMETGSNASYSFSDEERANALGKDTPQRKRESGDQADKIAELKRQLASITPSPAAEPFDGGPQVKATSVKQW
jgi:uncharacterized protein YegL